MTNYNDGKWHGWNGGECPVHPDSEVEVVGGYDVGTNTAIAGDDLYWPNVAAFRVVTPYIEETTYEGECWAYHYTCMEPSLASFNVNGICTHGKWTATHVDGKLHSFTWDADE